MTSVKGIELFAGCGGMSTGFLDAGLRVVSGFEIDKRAVEAYNYNHLYRGSQGFVADLSATSAESLLELAGVSSVEFVIGGPPCQPFSIAGKQNASSDRRSSLLEDFARIVLEIRPKAFVFENVPNLATVEGGALFDNLRAIFKEGGYKLSHGIVYAPDYGVPQMRRRLILLGSLGSRSITFPLPTHKHASMESVSAQRAIGDLPDAGEYEECGVYNHEPTEHSTAMLARIAGLQPGMREKGSFHDRLHPEKPSYTLRAGSGNFSPLRPIHYRYNRVITVRESARLQGFSDKFIWPDSIPRLQQYRQVGNAVPPLLARAFAVAVANHFGWKLDPKKFDGDPESRPPAITLSAEHKKAQRRALTRGASLGAASIPIKPEESFQESLKFG